MASWASTPRARALARPSNLLVLDEPLSGLDAPRLLSESDVVEPDERLARRDGVAVLAEGLVLSIPAEDLAELDEVERDAHGHVRIAEVSIGEILKSQVQARLKELGIKTTIVAKNIGYELRCADPIPFDQEYTQDLGYAAMSFLLQGKSGAMILPIVDRSGDAQLADCDIGRVLANAFIQVLVDVLNEASSMRSAWPNAVMIPPG